MQLKVSLSTDAEIFLNRISETNQKLYHIFSTHIDKLPDVYQKDSFLTGTAKGLRRHRVGDYRMIYRVVHHQLLIYVIEIGHRRDVYDR